MSDNKKPLRMNEKLDVHAMMVELAGEDIKGAVTRRPGQPTKYYSEINDEVLEHAKKGRSIEAIAALLGIPSRTFYVWKDEHEEFFHTLEVAKELEQLWWEEKANDYLIEHKDGPKLNSTIWNRSMAARFPKKYREQTKTEITGADGAPLISNISVSFVGKEDK